MGSHDHLRRAGIGWIDKILAFPTTVVGLHEAVYQFGRADFSLDELSGASAKAKNDARLKVPYHRLVKRPTLFGEITEAIRNAGFPFRAHEDDITGWNLAGFEAELFQQMHYPRLHTFPPRESVAPRFVAVFRPLVGFLVQDLGHVPAHGFGRLLYRIAPPD